LERRGGRSVKRKIAAIFAADVAGYSKLVAEDEEETLRRLASYRAVMDDFIARAGGRIFNTAGDAVLAEFPSAVEAVRCAIDIQESLRTRNLAYPSSRQMSFRIGITVGDVVERDGDLLGDGVNIAARLEGIAPVGGICISRTVHEQVANKLSVQFADIGEQQVKNIPTPVHAYKIEMRPDDGRPDAQRPKAPTRLLPLTVAAAGLLALGIAAFAYLTLIRQPKPQAAGQPAPPPIAAMTPAVPAAIPPASTAPPATAPPKKPPRQTEALVPDAIPLIADRARTSIRNEYLAAPDHKALAISSGPMGFSTGQADDEVAKTAALDICQKRVDAQSVPRRCELYALGNTVVYARGHPPMPPTPWVAPDASFARPLAVDDIPLLHGSGKGPIERRYLPGRKSKALAISPSGSFFFYINQDSTDEAVRRALEVCGNDSGIPCLIVAIDDDFVVPIPTVMKAVGFFHPASTATIAPELRDDVARRLGNGGAGWTAVATGAGGQVGLMLKAADEQAAIDGALTDCTRHDHSCSVIAIGPFSVEPK
jgi:class 3 adenylate cyclase